MELHALFQKAKREFFGPFADHAHLPITGPVEGAPTGLITVGPVSWIDALQRAIGRRVETYRTNAGENDPPMRTQWRRRAPGGILVLDHWFVICDQPSAREVEDHQDGG